MLGKDAFGYLSLVFTVLSYSPYVWSMLRGKTCPHIFSWIIWALVSAIVSIAQFIAYAGPGAWAPGLTAAFSLGVIFLSFSQKADWSITRSDWVMFIGGLSIIPLWYITSSPLVAAILATLIDAIAYYPTFRKFYHKPHEEMIFMYVIANMKHVASIFAIVEYSVTTLVFPVCIFAMNISLIAMLAYRRRVIAQEVPHVSG